MSNKKLTEDNNITNNDTSFEKELKEALKQKKNDEKWLRFAKKYKKKIYILSTLLFIMSLIILATKTVSLFLSMTSYLLFTISFSILVLKKEADILTFNSERLCFLGIISFALSLFLLLF